MTARRDVTHSPDKQALKAASKRLVRAVGGVEAAAQYSRPMLSQLSAYGHPNAPEFMPVDVIADLEAVTHQTPDHPVVTRMLARKAGFALVKIPVAPTGAADWHREIGAISKEVSEVISPVCELLGDGRITAEEIRSRGLREQIAEAQERLAALDALCAQALEEGQQ
jgi:alkylation response protein AidB-like acyl-CoA dehydrogenase